METSSKEFQHYMHHHQFETMTEALKDEVANSLSHGKLNGPTWKRMLANHVSTCCQPHKKGGVVPSLDSCFTHTASASGGYVCELVLPNLFEEVRDPPEQWSISRHGTTKADAQESCFFTTLLFCLVAGPRLVRLHSSTVRDVDRIRTMANDARTAAYKSATMGTLYWLEACWKTAPSSSLPETVSSASGSSMIVCRDKEIIDLLKSDWKKKPERVDPSYLPFHVRNFLDTHLPKKTLKTFLLSHPYDFAVHEGEGRRWQFSILQAYAGAPGSGTTAPGVAHAQPQPSYVAPGADQPAAQKAPRPTWSSSSRVRVAIVVSVVVPFLFFGIPLAFRSTEQTNWVLERSCIIQR